MPSSQPAGPISENPPDRNSPRLGSKALNGIAYGIAAAIGFFAALLPYLLNRRFYFHNDEETYCYPYYLEIGRSLRHGHWSLLTLNTFCGGNFSIDWELALYNPVSLFTYWLMAPMQNLEEMGLGVAGFYIILLSLGGYRLARSFDLGRDLALVMATVLVTNNFVIYFFAGAWITNLIGWCWFVWTWATLQAYKKSGRSPQLAGFILCAYLTVSSGFPHSLVMLAVLVVSYWMELSIEDGFFRAKANRLVWSGISVALMAAPMLLPAFLSTSWVSRVLTTFNHGFLTPRFDDLLNLSTFFHLPHMRVYNAPAPCMPLLYVAWFLTPLLPLLDWKIVVRALTGRWALGLFGLAGLLLLNGPEQLGPVRYPIRFLPYVATVLVLGFGLAAARPHAFIFSRRRMILALTVVLLGFASSTLERPEFFILQLFGTCLSLVLTVVAIFLIQTGATRLLPGWLLLGVLAGYLLMHECYTANLEIAGPNSNPIIPARLSDSEKAFAGYSLYAGPAPTASQSGWWRDFFFAAEATEQGVPSINGYSPLGHRTFSPKISGDNWCTIDQPAAIAYLFSSDPETGRQMMDLMRVNTLILNKKSTAIWAQPFLDQDWRETLTGTSTVHREKVNPDLRPTTLSWSAADVQVETKGAPSGESEQLVINAGTTGGDLVFARLWWPGYSATLDGHPLVVAPLDDLLVKVTVPPQAHGTLALNFTPPGFDFALVLAAMGVLVMSLTLTAKAPKIPLSKT